MRQRSGPIARQILSILVVMMMINIYNIDILPGGKVSPGAQVLRVVGRGKWGELRFPIFLFGNYLFDQLLTIIMMMT